jgi:hypothetical protein
MVMAQERDEVESYSRQDSQKAEQQAIMHHHYLQARKKARKNKLSTDQDQGGRQERTNKEESVQRTRFPRPFIVLSDICLRDGRPYVTQALQKVRQGQRRLLKLIRFHLIPRLFHRIRIAGRARCPFDAVRFGRRRYTFKMSRGYHFPDRLHERVADDDVYIGPGVAEATVISLVRTYCKTTGTNPSVFSANIQ